MTAMTGDTPWPTEIKLSKDRKALTIAFDTGESFALAAEYLALNVDDLEARIYTLPTEIDAEVARIKLEHLGGGVDSLTDDQVAYLSGWQEGTA